MSMPETSSCPPDRSRPSRAVGWQSAAACAGLSPRVVFSKKAKEAAAALRACAGCTVRRACEEAVAPADNWFDGVCGGRLWRSGRPVAVPDRLVPAPRPPSAPNSEPGPTTAPVLTTRPAPTTPPGLTTVPRRTAAPALTSAPVPTTASALQGGHLG
ncbi:WhiB family transcriptional regulator [Streptomyces sp. NPDC014995]|uniref:WhiB family transcriptional regulator n=1 Tax=Streptomyces sp. NPDC014995 TaxID=3364936 RepID=UPI0036FCD243